MKYQPLPNASDFEFTGKQIDEDRIDVYQVKDRRDKIIYNFADSHVDGYVAGFERISLQFNVAVYSDVFISVRGRPGGPAVPDMLGIRLPIFGGDNFTVRSTMQLLAMEANRDV